MLLSFSLIVSRSGIAFRRKEERADESSEGVLGVNGITGEIGLLDIETFDWDTRPPVGTETQIRFAVGVSHGDG